MNDHEVAGRLAAEAGELLLGVRTAFAEAGRAARKAAGDASAHDFLVEQLAELRPADAVLSEEGLDDPARLTADRVWIVDPLDGTKEFGELGRRDWAVHVALWQRDAPGADTGGLVAGAVALPAQGVTLHTPVVPLAPPVAGPPRVIVSRSRPPSVALRVRAALGGTLVELGSAGAKAMAVVRGSADVYLHSGGQYEWDSAAPVAVAAAAGLHTSRADGSPLRYNQHDTWLPDLLICRRELAEDILKITRDQLYWD
ncbi:MAG TPA: 3'(2'),5'-bisphosphate nucleotidase CysQ [Pseudonocardia sp.]